MKIKHLFDLYDKEGNGYLEWETFLTILYNYPKEQIEHILKEKIEERVELSTHKSVADLRKEVNIEMILDPKNDSKYISGDFETEEDIRNTKKHNPSDHDMDKVIHFDHGDKKTKGSGKAEGGAAKNQNGIGSEKTTIQLNEHDGIQRMESYATHVNFKVKKYAQDVEKRYRGPGEGKNLTWKNFKNFINEHSALLQQFQKIFHEDFWAVIDGCDEQDHLNYTLMYLALSFFF